MEMLKNSYFKEPGKVISGKIQFSSFRSLGKFGKFLNDLLCTVAIKQRRQRRQITDPQKRHQKGSKNR